MSLVPALLGGAKLVTSWIKVAQCARWAAGPLLLHRKNTFSKNTANDAAGPFLLQLGNLLFQMSFLLLHSLELLLNRFSCHNGFLYWMMMPL